MSEPVAGWLVRDGVRTRYLEWAPDHGAARSPAILLLHGLSSNAHYWDRVAGHLGPRRVVAVDQRGRSGGRISVMPASGGVRRPFFKLQKRHDTTKFSQES